MCDERSFFFIFLLHRDLMVPLSSVNEAVKLVTSCGVYQLVNCWQWVTVFGTCFVEICVVYINSHFPVLLRYRHHIGQSLWIVHHF